MIRTTKTKAAIETIFRDDDTKITFTKKNNGFVELHIQGHVKQECSEQETCDLGHRHWVTKKTKWVYETARISAKEVKDLCEWLSQDPNLWEPKA